MKNNIENGDLDEALNIEPQKKKNKKKIIIPLIIIVILSLIITLFCFLGNKKEQPNTEVSTTQATEWNEDYNGQDENQQEKYPDYSLPTLTVD